MWSARWFQFSCLDSVKLVVELRRVDSYGTERSRTLGMVSKRMHEQQIICKTVDRCIRDYAKGEQA